MVDFIQWYYDKFYWPAFNVADSAIFVGAAMLLISSFFAEDENQQSNA
ncbi:MAG: signal peptidase II [Pseudomonadota bacterium]